jgi:hypothetical protein
LAEIDVEIRSKINQIKQLHNGLLATAEDLLAASTSIKPVQQEITGTTLTRMLQKELHRSGSTPKL